MPDVAIYANYADPSVSIPKEILEELANFSLDVHVNLYFLGHVELEKPELRGPNSTTWAWLGMARSWSSRLERGCMV